MHIHDHFETTGTRLQEIIEEISHLNVHISSQMLRLNEEPGLVREITALMGRCGALISEAAEIRA